MPDCVQGGDVPDEEEEDQPKRKKRKKKRSQQMDTDSEEEDQLDLRKVDPPLPVRLVHPFEPLFCES